MGWRRSGVLRRLDPQLSGAGSDGPATPARSGRQQLSGWRPGANWRMASTGTLIGGLACHADEALVLLSDADAEERRLLGSSTSSRTGRCHADSSIARVPAGVVLMELSNRPAPWRWMQSQTVYWMNLRRVFPGTCHIILSPINPGNTVDPGRIVREIPYEHPLFSLGRCGLRRRFRG